MSVEECQVEQQDWQPRAFEVLERHWGYHAFRPLQQEAIQSVVEGRDSLVVLPTGGGKSLCYQVPALLHDGLTVVVSPLIALMKDQVDGLTDLGIAAAAVNSSQSAQEQREIATRIEAGEVKLLYVAPERLCTERMLNFLERQSLAVIAIDEAHCISTWGHQFRPEYRLLGPLRKRFPQVAMHAYTATATEQVRQDIVAQLRLQDAQVLVGDFDRPNLTYRVFPRQDIRRQVREVIDRFPGQAGIIYCQSRKQVEELNEFLQASGYRSAAYHAGLEHAQRQQGQEDFLNENVNIIVATVAFGMGIDKPNVRYVIHASATRSIENYQQETGRAGRDGLPAECHLFYGNRDFITWKKMLSDLPAEARASAEVQLRMKSDFCNGLRCRHRALVEHFGQTYAADNCGACDVCLGEMHELPDALVVAQKILSCVVRVEQRFGGDYVAGVLTGSRDHRILENGHDQLSTYGLLREYAKKEIRQWLDQLESQDLLIRRGEYNTLAVTPEGRRVFKGEVVPRLLQPRIDKASSRPQQGDLSADESQLFEALRQLRRSIAGEKQVAPFVIFGDVTLIDLARRRPDCADNFLQIHGVGQRKCQEYAARFIHVIQEFTETHGMTRNVDFSPATAAGQPVNSRPGADSTNSYDEESPGPLIGIQRQAAELFAEGLDLETVGERLSRARSTVAGYLVAYLERERRTSPTPWVEEEVFQKVALAALEQESERLKPLFDALEGTVPYDDLRLCIVCLKNIGGEGLAE